MRVGRLAILFVALAALTPGQETRAEQIEQERRAKARELKPTVPGRVESTLLYVQENNLLQRLQTGLNGWTVAFGNLVSGAGFGLGPRYQRPELFDGNWTFTAQAIASATKAYRFDAELTNPVLFRNRMFTSLQGSFRNFPRMQYYGPGPDSRKTGRADYRLEEASFDAMLGARLGRRVRAGARFGLLAVNVGPGTQPRFANAETLYSPRVTPGIDQQSSFVRSGGFLEYDSRDNPGGPRKGTYAVADYTIFNDVVAGRFSNNQLRLEAQQYIPFFNERRVIALRGRTVMAAAHGGNEVPFFLQPRLGSGFDLRGYRPFRFYDDNSLVANAEYRWEVFSGLDMALFFDAGKVVPHRSQLNFHDLKTNWGFGFRGNARNNVFLRVDTAFSYEGWQLWVNFANVF